MPEEIRKCARVSQFLTDPEIPRTRMKELNADSILSRAWTVSHELPEDDQLAFYDEQKSELVVVNALGGAVWQLIDGKRNIRDIAQVIVDEVEDSPPLDQVQAAVLTFVKGLIERKAITLLS